ncbi:trehalose-phosphatase [Chloroflexota bacterium]
MQYLFDAWNKVSRRLKTANHILLLCDFDGTLTPIVDKPEMVSLAPDTRKLIWTLAKNRRFTVGIISGRALSDLKERVGIDSVVYSGNHGLEIEGFGTNFLEPIAEEVRPFFQILGQVLTITLRGIKGVFVENKGLTLSVHYRSVDVAEEQKVFEAFNKVTNPLHMTGRIKVTKGKKVYEIRPPSDWDKGKAIAWLINKFKENRRKAKTLPVYLGDDLTDEDAFKVIEGYRGISIYVGDEDVKSAARYYLKSPDDVTELLRML